MKPWHANREEVFAVMRQVDAIVHHEWRQARDLGPRNGVLSVGSQDFDHTLKAMIGESYLRVLNRGGTPNEAFEAAVKDGEESIDKWNQIGCKGRAIASGRYELHRDKCAAGSHALGFHSRFRSFVETNNQPAEAFKTVRPVVLSPVHFNDAIVNGNSYCGPVCLSVLTGIPTKEIAAILRREHGLKSVRGLSTNLLLWFLQRCGYEHETSVVGRSLAQWKQTAEPGEVYVIDLERHFVVVRGDRIACTQFDGRINDLKESVYLNERVQLSHKITGTLNLNGFKQLANGKQRLLFA